MLIFLLQTYTNLRSSRITSSQKFLLLIAQEFEKFMTSDWALSSSLFLGRAVSVVPYNLRNLRIIKCTEIPTAIIAYYLKLLSKWLPNWVLLHSISQIVFADSMTSVNDTDGRDAYLKCEFVTLRIFWKENWIPRLIDVVL